jgi:septal ring factor EnvC (AmiA/AmiB activator)
MDNVEKLALQTTIRKYEAEIKAAQTKRGELQQQNSELFEAQNAAIRASRKAAADVEAQDRVIDRLREQLAKLRENLPREPVAH